MATPTVPKRYPLMYFFCDALVKPELVQSVLRLPKAPRLRKAKIIGYQRSSCDTESAVILDGMNFGCWAAKELVKGVAYEVANEVEERLLLEHVGAACRVAPVDIEVKLTWLGRWKFRGVAFFSRLEKLGLDGERQLTTEGLVNSGRPPIDKAGTYPSPEPVAKREEDMAKYLRMLESAPARTEEIESVSTVRMASAALRNAPRKKMGHERTAHVTPAFIGPRKDGAIVDNIPELLMEYNRSSRAQQSIFRVASTLDVPAATESGKDSSPSIPLADAVIQVPTIRQPQSNIQSTHKTRAAGKFKSTVLPNGTSIFDFAFPAKIEGRD